MGNILAVDPGKTTGYVIWNPEERREGELYVEAFLDLAWEQISSGRIDTVVCERFVINARTATLTQAPWSLEQIGALRFMCQKFDVNFVLQNASEAKKFATDKRLNDYGWPRPQGAGHARDAQRHLLIYLVNHRVIDLTTLLSPSTD